MRQVDFYFQPLTSNKDNAEADSTNIDFDGTTQNEIQSENDKRELLTAFDASRVSYNICDEFKYGFALAKGAYLDKHVLFRIIHIGIFLGRHMEALVLITQYTDRFGCCIDILRLKHDLDRSTLNRARAIEMAQEIVSSSEATPNDFLRQAGDFVFSGNFFEANEILLKLQEANPGFVDAYSWGLHVAQFFGECGAFVKWSKLAKENNILQIGSYCDDYVAQDERTPEYRQEAFVLPEPTLPFEQSVTQFSDPSNGARKGVLLNDIFYKLKLNCTSYVSRQATTMLPVHIFSRLTGFNDRALRDAYRNDLLAHFYPLWDKNGRFRHFNEMITYVLCLYVLEDENIQIYDDYIAANSGKLSKLHIFILCSRTLDLFRLANVFARRNPEGTSSSKFAILEWVIRSKLYPGVMELHAADTPPLPKYRECGTLRTQISSSFRARKPKVGICVSGQMRNYAVALDQWKALNLISDESDVFLSTWRLTGAKAFVNADQVWRHFAPDLAPRVADYISLNSLQDFIANIPPSLFSKLGLEGNVEAVNLEELENLYQPRAMRIEDEPQAQERGSIHHNTEKMLYKIEDCFLLAASCGLADYDLIIRIRPDKNLYGLPANWAEQALDIIGENRVILTGRPAFYEPSLHPTTGVVIDDMFAIGRPKEMEIYSTTYSYFYDMPENKRSRYPNHLGGHWPLSYRLIESGIVIAGTGWGGAATFSSSLITRDEFTLAINGFARADFLKFFLGDWSVSGG